MVYNIFQQSSQATVLNAWSLGHPIQLGTCLWRADWIQNRTDGKFGNPLTPGIQGRRENPGGER
jgi:hypothetical protein